MTPPKKRATIILGSIKEPDGWNDLAYALGLRSDDGVDAKFEEHFDCGEYASLEVEIDEDLNIVGGRVLPLKNGRCQ